MTNTEIKKLPNIIQLVSMLKKSEQQTMAKMGGWHNYKSALETSMVTLDIINSPYHAYCNNGEDCQFITTRTVSGRMTLTPNLKNKPYLYRGQNKKYKQIISSFERDNLEDKLKNNLLVEDFITLLRTHPVFMMFDHGIKLDGYRDKFYFNMNYYGLGQHYGFKTGVVDFTSDIDVAAFFACTKSIGHDKYAPIEHSTDSYGVIYVHNIKPEQTLKVLGFSTIGLQLYPRTGAQKGLLYNQDGRFPPVDNMVVPYYFRHDTMASNHIFKSMNGGELLFPKDSLSEIACEILNSNEVSGETFALNLYSNSEDCNTNIERLDRMGMKVNWNKRMLFTPEMLEPFYEDMKNGYWEQFCNMIYFGGENDKRLREQMLHLPQNENYSQYFNIDEWQRLQAYNFDLARRASVNKTKKKS